jgi:DNA-binding beta-propeller fold protein YncE
MRRRGVIACASLLLTLGACAASPGARGPSSVETAAPRVASQENSDVQHYLYVVPDQSIYVYDIDHGYRLVQRIALPRLTGVRGVAASPATHTLYISHGDDNGPDGSGSLLAYDLLSGHVLWDHSYRRGIDSMAIDSTGDRIYMPDGELSSDGIWTVIDARSGDVIGRITGGKGPHNTVVGLSGARVYLGGRDSPYLAVASTRTDRVIRRIGPLRSGVRPFTINGAETLAFTTATGFLGFQVSSIRTGRVLYTSGFGSRFRYNPATFAPSAPSHGISLSPDERELWVIDAPNSYIHVFDVSGLPDRPPRHVADIKLADRLVGSERGCSYDCARDGWLQHSLDGRFVYVGDAGDVIDTRSLRVVAYLPALRQTRKMLEIDWRGGVPVATSSREGLGYVR